MDGLSPRARQMIADLEKQGASPDQIQNLTAAIEVSPELSKQVNGAAGQHVGSFGMLQDPNAAGEFDPSSRAVNLPPADLSAAKPGTMEARELTFTVGHEVQHSYNQYDVAKADAKFADTARSIAQSPGPIHDYTAAVAEVQAAHRNDEARAEIAGWNATVSAAQAESKRTNGPAPTLESLYNQDPNTMGEFIQVDQGKMPNTYALRSNLTLNDDLTMPITPANIEGMGKNYVDKPGANLGPVGNSGYADLYGASSVSTIAQMERTYGDGKATVALDMNKLGLHQDIMEQNGIDLGSSHKPLSYIDTGTSPPSKHQFIQTASSPEASTEKRSASHLDDASHPDNGMYQQARDAVHRLDEQHGRQPDQQSDNLAASLTVAARGQGMDGIDHVVLSGDASRAYAVQGQMDSPLKQVAEVQTAQAANTSIAQSSDAWQQVSAQQSQQQAQQPQASQDASVSQQQSGPVQAITMPPPGGGGGGGGAGAGGGAPPGGQ